MPYLLCSAVGFVVVAVCAAVDDYRTWKAKNHA